VDGSPPALPLRVIGVGAQITGDDVVHQHGPECPVHASEGSGHVDHLGPLSGFAAAPLRGAQRAQPEVASQALERACRDAVALPAGHVRSHRGARRGAESPHLGRWLHAARSQSIRRVTPLDRQKPEKNTECEALPSVPPATRRFRSSGDSQMSTRSPSVVQSPWGMLPSGG